MQYREEENVARAYKERYVKGIEQLIEKRQKAAEPIRKKYVKDIFEKPEAYREDLKNMLGWPLADYCAETLPNVHMELLSTEDGYAVYRAEFEILEGFFMAGLFFKETGGEKKPLVIVQHGGQGTPERISGVYGSTELYHDMLSRVRDMGVHVFAPQLLLWADSYGVPFDRKSIDARLKRVGSSIAAVEIFGIRRILDYFEDADYVSAFGMVGLSYGGFYTLFTSAIDTRIKASISCSFFNTRDKFPWSDWVWNDSAYLFDDAEAACLVYPRKLYIAIGDNDEMFDSRYSVEAFRKLTTLCEEVGTDWVTFEVFSGTHEFFSGDAPIQKLIDEIK